ncbi:MAG: hypothetical protein HY319_16225 [Armatimonadetes bacterium]|nr:hypothetical protein [Armatimonadota bacterium]
MMDFPVIELERLRVSWPWPETSRTRDQVVLSQGAESLTLRVEPGPPALPCSLDEVDELRRFARRKAQLRGGGLIELDVYGPSILGVIKLPEEYAFEAELMIPFVDRAYRLTVRSTETGTRGVREAALSVLPRYRERWFCDLYEPELAGPGVRSAADSEEHDESFPDHPLSRVRKLSRLLPRLLELTSQPPAFAGVTRQNRARALDALGDCAGVVAELPGRLEAPLELLLRGRARLRLNQPELAAEDLREALVRDPDPQTVMHLGGAQLALGHPREAVVAYTMALGREPGNREALLGRAQARTAAHDLEGALEDYRARLQADPLEPDLYRLRAEVLWRAGRRLEALADLNHALTLYPLQEDVFETAVRFLVDMGRPELAGQRLEQWLQLNPRSEEARNRLTPVARRPPDRPQRA